MLKRNRWFITLALVHLLLAGLVGITRIGAPWQLPGDAARLHGHLMLIGFVTMMIYGIGLHILPRFAGRALFSERMADVQFAVSVLGLWTMVYGWMVTNESALTIGAAATWLAMTLFAVNIVLTVRLFGPRL